MKRINKWLKGFIIIQFLILSFNLTGQDNHIIDSLKLELNKQKTDTARIRLLLNLASKYSTNDSTIAFNYISQAKRINQHVNDKKYQADILLQEGIVYRYMSAYTKALPKFEQAISIYNKLQLKSKIANCYIWIGGLFGEQEQNTKALEYYGKALDIYKLLDLKDGLSRSYTSMATIYCKKEEYKKAIEYSRLSIAFTDKKDQYELARKYMNLFTYYANTDKEKALTLIDSIIPPLKKANDLASLSKIYQNLGLVYVELKNYSEAKNCISNAINYSTKLGNLNAIIWNNIALASVYKETNMIDSAIFVLEKSMHLKNAPYNQGVYVWIYNMLHEFYKIKGNSRLALDYYEKYIAVSDSVTGDRYSQEILDMQTKYDVDLKNEQIKVLAKNQQLAKQKIIILVISLLIAILCGSFFIYYRYRKAQEKKLLYEAELKEKEYKHQAELKVAAYQIELKKRELTYKAIDIAQKEQILSTVREQLESIKTENAKTKETIMDLLSGINTQLKQNSFEDFEKYFIEVHPGFYSTLKQNYNELTQNELKICALIKLNLSIKQIADITGKSTRSVENARYIIRKKMGLAIEENLFDKIAIH